MLTLNNLAGHPGPNATMFPPLPLGLQFGQITAVGHGHWTRLRTMLPTKESCKRGSNHTRSKMDTQKNKRLTFAKLGHLQEVPSIFHLHYRENLPQSQDKAQPAADPA
jgi:hypothetical protein